MVPQPSILLVLKLKSTKHSKVELAKDHNPVCIEHFPTLNGPFQEDNFIAVMQLKQLNMHRRLKVLRTLILYLIL